MRKSNIDIHKMDLKELKLLLRKINSCENNKNRALKSNVAYCKLNEKRKVLKKRTDKLYDAVDKLEQDKYGYITTDGDAPRFDYRDGEKSSNISDNFKQAIKNAGFKVSLLKDRDVTEMAEEIADLQIPKQVKEMESKQEILQKQDDDLFHKECKIEDAMEKKHMGIYKDVSDYRVKDRIFFLEDTKNDPDRLKKFAKKRGEILKFVGSSEKINAELKKLMGEK